MKRPNFNEKTEVKVIDKERIGYGQRGKVVRLGAIVGEGKMLDPVMDKEKIKQAYADGLEPKIVWEVLVRFKDGDECWFGAEDVEPVQYKFIDIDYIREKDLDLGTLKPDGTKVIRPKNIGAFEPGDIISITTKIDGANASIAWDTTTQKLEIFSRTNLLTQPGSLRGFYDYIKTKVEPLVEKWDGYKDLVFFGEWCVGHSIKSYNKEWFNKWRIYDIWNKVSNCYCLQTEVKQICKFIGLEYIEELYYGPFISWKHCKSFLNKSIAYGPEQEGVVIKNQSKLGREDNRNPVYIKIVNDTFKEAQHSKKEKTTVDLIKEAEKQNAAKLAANIVTEARVKKTILKLIDEGKLPCELQPTDMGKVMKFLPRLVFDDCCKEEAEIVELLGEYAGKCIAAETAKYARKIIVGA